jgi:Spy/CpxP family protein refolding chaperone
MRRLVAAAGAGLLLATALATPALAAQKHGEPDHGQEHGSGTGGFSFGVIGDVPYGRAEIQSFPSYIRDINAHRELSFVGHVGDIKSGSSLCSDSYFATIRHDFDTVTLPLVYTPGDNEWTDCHRANNGTYNPLERLAAVRKVFFPRAGVTLGTPMAVESQAKRGYPENVNFSMQHVAVTAVNIPGSDNSMPPWSGLGETAPTAAQLAEVRQRTKADIKELETTFHEARENHDRAVVIMTQADMFDPTVTNPAQSDYAGFTPLVKTLIEQSNAFGGAVSLINGDSHLFTEDHPLAAGSPWLSFSGQTAAEGTPGLLTFQRIPFAQPAP